MKINFRKICLRLLIYSMIMIFTLSTFLIIGTSDAQAAGKKLENRTKTSGMREKTPSKKIISKDKNVSPIKKTKAPEIKSAPILLSQKGTEDQKTYYPGDQIRLALIFSGEVEKVWAEIGNLDPNLPEIQPLLKESNTWKLASLPLSASLNLGSQMIMIKAQNSIGISSFNFNIVLAKKTVFLPIKTLVKDHEIELFWATQKNARQYLVMWSEPEKNIFHSQVASENFFTVTNLNSGTLYQIEVTGVDFNGNLLTSEKIMVQTSGVKIKPQVEGVSTLEPAIGKGISDISPRVAQKPKEIQESVSPSPSPSASEPVSEKEGGFNRVLVGLAILIIAIGAAIGGYYGYEWWSSREKKDEEDSKSSSSRW